MSGAPGEALGPTPAGSRWGRNAARVYLAVTALAFALMLRDVAVGATGLGTLAVSVLTAPWSALLAPLARAIHGRVPDAVLRGLGIVLAAACAALNGRVLYGIGARMERDVRRPAS